VCCKALLPFAQAFVLECAQVLVMAAEVLAAESGSVP